MAAVQSAEISGGRIHIANEATAFTFSISAKKTANGTVSGSVYILSNVTTSLRTYAKQLTFPDANSAHIVTRSFGYKRFRTADKEVQAHMEVDLATGGNLGSGGFRVIADADGSVLLESGGLVPFEFADGAGVKIQAEVPV